MPSYQVRQSTTAYPLVFLLVDSTDHIAGKTGLTPTVTIRKVGGSFASPAGAVTELAHGWYQVAGNATDSNTLGPLLLHATGTGADPTDVLYEVVAYDPQDAVRQGLTALPAVASGSAGAVVTSGTGTAQLSTSAGLVTLAGVTHTGAVVPTVSAVTGAVGSVTGNVGGNVAGSVGSVTAAVTAGTVSDKTGYALTSGERTSIATAVGTLFGIPGTVTDAGAAVGDFDGDSGLSSSNDTYNGMVLLFTSGNLDGQNRKISDYVGSSRNFSFTGATGAADAPFPAAPDNGSTFLITGRG